MKPSVWADLLYNYGPFALIVFFAGVTLTISGRKLKEDPNSSLLRRIYATNWIAIFVLGIVLTGIWMYLHLEEKAVLRGTIQNLPSEFTVSNDLTQEGVNLYTLKRYSDREKGLIRYEWAVLSDRRLGDGQTISIVISAPAATAATTKPDRELKLKLSASSYDSPVTIRYHPKQDKFTLEQQGKETDIESVDLSRASPTTPEGRGSFLPVVYANVQVDFTAMTSRLGSPDPIIRRDARTDLASLNRDGLPYIENVLSDPSSPSKVRLGVVAALNQMRDPHVAELLSAQSLVVLLRGIGASDNDYRSETRKFVQQRASWDMEMKTYELLTGSSKGDRTQIALADMDLLYNLGIREKDMYGGQKDRKHLLSAISAFEKAWNDRRFASSSTQVYFAKALYGWALTLADQSVLDLDSSGKRRPELIKAAQAKFQDFLTAATSTAGSPSYYAPEQVQTAKSYLENPTLR